MALVDLEAGWLAGLWDGEGSVGLRRVTITNISPSLQMSMTCKVTIDRVIELLAKIGVQGLGYSYEERAPHHKDAHYLRVNRMTDCRLVLEAIAPHSITKRAQWKILDEYITRRLACRRIMPDGRLARGGIPLSPLGPREFELYDQMRKLNYRARPNQSGLDADYQSVPRRRGRDGGYKATAT